MLAIAGGVVVAVLVLLGLGAVARAPGELAKVAAETPPVSDRTGGFIILGVLLLFVLAVVWAVVTA